MRRKSPLIKQNILNFIKSYSSENGFSPSIREIAVAVGLRSTSGTNSYINDLVKDGFLRKSPSKSRALDIIDDNVDVEDSSDNPTIPILKGYKPGLQLFEPSNFSAYMSIPLPQGCDSKRLFALKATDNSMSGAGIFTGDITIAERPQHVDDGSCVVCIKGDELVIRYLYLEGSRVRLVPDDPGYEQEILPSCQVVGVVLSNIHFGINREV